MLLYTFFLNTRFRGCLWASLFIMGLLAGDYTCRVTLLLSFCAGTVVLRGGLRPPLFIMGLLVGDYICHLRLLLSLCAGRQPAATSFHNAATQQTAFKIKYIVYDIVYSTLYIYSTLYVRCNTLYTICNNTLQLYVEYITCIYYRYIYIL